MAPKPVKPTRRTRRVLLALLTGADNLSGYPIARMIGSGSGGVYLTLSRLEHAGWVTGQWEHHADGTPRRRYYRLTAEGIEDAIGMLRLEASAPPVSWSGRATAEAKKRIRPPA
jgi:PadR family transcriptional regulator PadR